ncbi:putative xylanase/chitin deacetylase [Gottschalkia purinilytica]|uniref:Putative xylanase/chitin deacetylase n=1 Tax=Gottschalkia purinilytica TaxID=1503 RepID=A0A0L0WCU6_GOTPU|nr:polysaccharide deacetylase family protein [Gottschalkia purinilytica]KNF09292.1 putative xylanase/chitin deacetylase [Gottschalkia purinilytica]
MNKIIAIITCIFLTFTGCSSVKSSGNQLNKQDDKKEVSSKVDNLQNQNDIADKIPVLMYHHIMEPNHIKEMKQEQNSSVISNIQFEEQMKFLHDNGFYVATLHELKEFIEGKKELPKKTVVITFDDGYLSNVTYAYPILKKYDFKATIFMIGTYMFGDTAEYDFKKLQFLKLKDLNKYKDVFSFESHTYDLHRLNDNNEGLLIASSKKDVLNDITKNKELLGAKYLAYPFGKRNPSAIKALKETNHEMAFTIENGYVTKDSNKIYELPRFGILPDTSMEEFKKIVLIKK